MPEPIHPTRIIPPGPPPLPPPIVVAADEPPPGPLVIAVPIYLPWPADPGPEPDGPSWGERLQLRRNATAVLLALVPASGWGDLLTTCRTQASAGGAWTLAGLALLVTLTADRWRPRWYSRALVWVAALGAADMAHPYDIVTLFTGVSP